MQTIAIYPGTFDPLTNGHADIVARAARLFDEVVVAITTNPQKQGFFRVAEREHMAKQVLADLPNVTVECFQELLVDYAKRRQANIIIRGLRAVSDFEYEFQLASMNRHLVPEIESIFLTPDEKFAYISSTLVKEIANLGGDVAQFVHPVVKEALAKR